jgi:hypothetical protein
MIALFPCKIDPPHLGHAITLLGIRDDYTHVIVDVLDTGKERFVPAGDAIALLDRVLGCFPGTYRYRTHTTSYTRSLDDLPDFDVVVSGNMRLLEFMHDHGYAVCYIERVPAYHAGCIRRAYRDGLEYDRQMASAGFAIYEE